MSARPIVVLGLMGAGKTTLAAALAAALQRPLHDSDADIEDDTGREAADIAACRGGRERLHDLEAKHLRDALQADAGVIAAAASVVDRAALRAALERAFVIWLDAPPDVLAKRFHANPHRPVYGDADEVLKRHDRRRRPHFGAIADIVLDATKDPQVLVGQAIAAVREHDDV